MKSRAAGNGCMRTGRIGGELEDSEHSDEPEQSKHRREIADGRSEGPAASADAACGGVDAQPLTAAVHLSIRLEGCEVDLCRPPGQHGENIQPVPPAEQELAAADRMCLMARKCVQQERPLWVSSATSINQGVCAR